MDGWKTGFFLGWLGDRCELLVSGRVYYIILEGHFKFPAFKTNSRACFKNPSGPQERGYCWPWSSKKETQCRTCQWKTGNVCNYRHVLPGPTRIVSDASETSVIKVRHNVNPSEPKQHLAINCFSLTVISRMVWQAPLGVIGLCTQIPLWELSKKNLEYKHQLGFGIPSDTPAMEILKSSSADEKLRSNTAVWPCTYLGSNMIEHDRSSLRH